MTDPTEPPRYDAIIAGLKSGELTLQPVFGEDGQLLYYALLPAKLPKAESDDRFPPTVRHDPRRTKPL